MSTAKETLREAPQDQQVVSVFEAMPETGSAPSSVRELFDHFGPLVSSILGLAFCRAGLIVAGYGSYVNTDEGLLTDGAMFVSICIMAVLLLVMFVTKFRMKKPTTNRLMWACIVTEAACVAATPLLDAVGAMNYAARFCLSVGATLFASGCMFYWLRRVRGCGSLTAVFFAFVALAISEVEIYLCSIAHEAGFVIATAFVLVQFPCLRVARKNTLANDISSFTPTSDYFSFAKDLNFSKMLLSSTAISLGFLFVVVGFLRGYPDGLSIAFRPATRVAYGLLTIVLCFAVIHLVARRRQNIMTIGAFLLFSALAAGALLLYAMFPDQLDIGAVLTTTLNALMCGFMWYLTIAFMSFGWRDPYYYGLAGWVVCMGCRSAARVLFIVSPMATQDDILVNAAMSMVLLFAATAALYQFFIIQRSCASDRVKRDEARIEALERRIEQLKNEQATARVTLGDLQGANSCTTCSACADDYSVGVTLDEILPERDAGVDPNTASTSGEGGVRAEGPAANLLAGNGAHSSGQRMSTLQRLMALDADEEAEDSYQTVMHRKAEAIGKQFLLSEREVEVLAFYSQGWTQKRVAEELFISPGTVHAHIKRIYAKTGLHSRQEILDYMDQYVS